MKNSATQVSTELEGDLKEKFEALKKYYGIHNDAELVKVLVNEKARQLNVCPMEATTNAH
jgi:hypothetical protein